MFSACCTLGFLWQCELNKLPIKACKLWSLSCGQGMTGEMLFWGCSLENEEGNMPDLISKSLKRNVGFHESVTTALHLHTVEGAHSLKWVEKKKKKLYRKGEVLFLWCFSFLMARKASRIPLALLVLSDGEILPKQRLTRKIKKDKMYVHLTVSKISSQSGLETTAQICKLLSIF